VIRLLIGLLVVLAGCSAATTGAGPNLTATLTTPTDITLTWHPADPAAAGQIVEYTNEAGTNYTILAFLPPTGSTYKHPDLIPQTSFYYRIRPYYGPASTPVDVTLPPGEIDVSTPDDGDWARPVTLPGTPAGSPARTASAAPTAVTSTVVNPNGIRFTWTDNCSDEEGAYLEVKAAGSSDYKVAAVLDPDVNAYGLTTLPEEKQASYRIRPVAYGPATNVAHQTTGDQAR
jgi:hypothetical protein